MEAKDVEQRSYKYAFFLGILLLCAMSLWALLDEVYARRPWKRYQRAFYDQQYAEARQDIEETRAALEAREEYQALLEDIALAEEAFNRPEVKRDYRQAVRNLDEGNTRLFEVMQEFNFSKAEAEEAFYNWKHVVHQGREADHLRAKWEALTEQTDSLLVQIDEARKERDEAGKRMRQFTAELDRLKAEREEMEDDLRKAEFRYSTTYDRIGLPGITIATKKAQQIQQVIIGELDLVERCHSCHISIDKAGFEGRENPYRTHPYRELYLGNHPVERFGCTVCHHGQGRALASAESAHGYIEHWEDPLLTGDDIQSSCRKCHQDTLNLPGAPLLNRGKKAIIQFGCYGCHDIAGFNHFDKVGPDLRHVGMKLKPEWAYSWIHDPQGYAPRTRMPSMLLTEDEVSAMVAYLFSASENLDQTDFPPPSQTEGDPVEGKKIFETAGCPACHKINGQGSTTSADYTRQFAPDLGKVGSKTTPAWIAYWIGNPKRYNPKTKMPQPRLTEGEIADVAAYLSTLRGDVPMPTDLKEKLTDPQQIARGERLIATYGCYGCHEITGMEGLSKVSVELSTFGSKSVDELAFGDEVDIPETWDAWTFNKLKNPRSYQTEAVPQKMPQFFMSDEEASFIKLVLKSFRDEEAHPDFRATLRGSDKRIEDGRWLAWYYNCTGCHIVENTGGDIRDLYEDPGLAPPPLYDEGAKVQPDWLYEFIRAPATLRPWLDVQMPNFALTDHQASTLVHYFLALEKIDIPFLDIQEPDPASEEVKEAKQLFEMLKCIQCHQLETTTELSPSDLAPDLALARKRLRPDWIRRWLIDPQVLYPGTRMPTYFPVEDEDEPDSPLMTPFEDILEGDARKQIRALSDYLMVIDQNS